MKEIRILKRNDVPVVNYGKKIISNKIGGIWRSWEGEGNLPTNGNEKSEQTKTNRQTDRQTKRHYDKGKKGSTVVREGECMD